MRARWLGLVSGFLLLVVGSARAQSRVVIVSGLGGEAKYSAEFAHDAASLAAALHDRFAIPDSNIFWFGEDSGSKAPRFRGQSTKANIEKAILAIAGHAEPASQFVLVLIGHGAGDGPEARLSIPGPDLDAKDFARLLAAFPTQRTAFVNLSSGSGDMIATLTALNRVVITATKTTFERNESHFGSYFVEAFTQPGADVDKDGRVSLLEAFRYAALETKRFYEKGSLLQTEHAQLADEGAKEGNADPTGAFGDGALARRFFLDGGRQRTVASANDPKLDVLYADQFAIQEQVEALRAKKKTMTADEYDAALEPLLVALARKSREIRVMEGRT